jgi:branched-chain amino acid transport system ATP-binding protein
MLEVKNIDAGYGDLKVLSDVSMKFEENKITLLMGPNGAGKSTLLKTIFGLIKPTNGSILLNNEVIKPEPHKLIKMGVSFVPQDYRVFTNMTVRENLEIGVHFIKDKKIVKQRIEEISELFPMLMPRLDDLAGNLSGGQQQMLAIARGLITKPKIMLLDEPSIGLSPGLVVETFNKIKEINSKLNTSFIIVEHNLKSLLPIVDYAYILNQGKVVSEGRSDSNTIKKMLDQIFVE